MSSEENSDDRPITVGVIDDDPMICQAMRLILEDYSTGRLNVVFTCTDGGQAVDEAGRHHPDVVLMDIAMPAWTASRRHEDCAHFRSRRMC